MKNIKSTAESCNQLLTIILQNRSYKLNQIIRTFISEYANLKHGRNTKIKDTKINSNIIINLYVQNMRIKSISSSIRLN